MEENFRAPADVPSNKLLGLFSQSTGESGPFSFQDIVEDGPGPEEQVVQPGQPDPDEVDEVYQSDEPPSAPTVYPPALVCSGVY